MTEEEIQQRVARGLELHKQNYNCAQSVAMATYDLADLDAEMTFRVMEAFGKGFGDKTQICGAISGGCGVVGARLSNGSELHNSKEETVKVSARLRQDFVEKWGTSTCEPLRPEDHSKLMEVCDGYIAYMIEAVCREIG